MFLEGSGEGRREERYIIKVRLLSDLGEAKEMIRLYRSEHSLYLIFCEDTALQLKNFSCECS